MLDEIIATYREMAREIEKREELLVVIVDLIKRGGSSNRDKKSKSE